LTRHWSEIEAPDKNALEHLFRRGILAAAHGAFEVQTLPALPFEKFLDVVEEIRSPEASGAEQNLLRELEDL
jgi:hypothetical protein